MSALVRRSGLLLAVALLISGCSDFGGLPKGVDFGNWTSQSITITLNEGGRALVNDLEPMKVGSITVQMNGVGTDCVGATYVAIGANGKEVARSSSGDCDDWLVALDPIPFSITNDTGAAVDIFYVGQAEHLVTAGLMPGSSFSGTVQDFGDSSELCLNGWLAARSANRSELRVDISGCDTWNWHVATGRPVPTPIR